MNDSPADGRINEVIVEPDFCDHWKTRMLVNLLKDEAAPVYVLRIWAHCQNRKQDEFTNLSSEALKALCHFPGHSNQLESSLVASGFVRRGDQGELIIIGWAEYNSSLLAAWDNGRKGGRPKKPTGNPRVTHGQPTANPGETDKRREDQIRVDKSGEENTNTPYPLLGGDGDISTDAGSDASPDPPPGKPIPPELSDWLRWWNGLAARKLVPHRVDVENPSRAVLKNWGRSRKDAKQVERLESRELVEAMIVRSPFCKEPWFRLEKLLYGTNGDGEFILVKLLDGGYAGDRNKRAGVGVADHDPNASPRVF